MLVRTKCGQEMWIPLRDTQLTRPYLLLPEALRRRQFFDWWVQWTMRKRNMIIAKIKGRLKSSFKYGIEVPTSFEHAMEIDRKNGKTLWYDAWV